MFTLVDSAGNPVEGQQLGLLLYRGGTVCDDKFHDNAAEAICRQINSSYSMLEWTSNSGVTFDIQDNLDIKLDEVQCTAADWESCAFSEEHDCEHGEDVFLACSGIVKVALTIRLRGTPSNESSSKNLHSVR